MYWVRWPERLLRGRRSVVLLVRLGCRSHSNLLRGGLRQNRADLRSSGSQMRSVY